MNIDVLSEPEDSTSCLETVINLVVLFFESWIFSAMSFKLYFSIALLPAIAITESDSDELIAAWALLDTATLSILGQ